MCESKENLVEDEQSFQLSVVLKKQYVGVLRT